MKSSTIIMKFLVSMALISTAIGDDNLQDLSSGYVPHDKTVYLIRHADKNGQNGDLCAAGVYRAKQLKHVFNGKEYHSDKVKFAEPNGLFAYMYKEGDHQRCYETLSYVTTGQHIHKVDYVKGSDSNKKGAHDILKGKNGFKKHHVVLAAWEHLHMKGMAEALGMEDTHLHNFDCKQHGDPWPNNNEFDYVYTFKYGNWPHDLKPTSITCRHEGIHIPKPYYEEHGKMSCHYNPYAKKMNQVEL